jgi:hypothetical protein
MLNPWYCATLLAFEAHDVMRSDDENSWRWE